MQTEMRQKSEVGHKRFLCVMAKNLDLLCREWGTIEQFGTKEELVRVGV